MHSSNFLFIQQIVIYCCSSRHGHHVEIRLEFLPRRLNKMDTFLAADKHFLLGSRFALCDKNTVRKYSMLQLKSILIQFINIML